MVDRPQKTEEKPRRGRPTLSEAALSERRAEIAAVAIQLFNEEGYASVSMRRLGKEVGLTPMALYRYFSNKLEILTALWDHVIGLALRMSRQRQAVPEMLRIVCTVCLKPMLHIGLNMLSNTSSSS